MIWTTRDRRGVCIDRRMLGEWRGPDGPDVSPRLLLTGINFRLDNRGELAADLGLDGAGDEAILLAGWAQWGEGVPDRLRGAFSFVIHDRAAGTVFLARDIFGLSPLYYSLDEDRLLAASTPVALRSMLPEIPRHDARMLSDFVSGAVLEKERTFFEGCRRLPPAHHLTVSRDDERQATYWSIADIDALHAPEEPEERFRTLFDAAVARTFVPGETAILLSGGLDSSAIAGSAHACNLSQDGWPAYAMTFPDADHWNDAPHLRAAARSARCTLHEYPSDTHDPFADMERWLAAVDGPYLPAGHSISMRLAPIIHAAGPRVALSGHGGDEIVSYGFGRLNELAKAGKWPAVWREIGALTDLQGGSRLMMFRIYLSHLNWVRRIERRLAHLRKRDEVVSETYLAPARFAQLETDRYQFRPARNRIDHDERMLHEEALTSALQPLSLEVFALCGDDSGVEIRMPFYDRDLAEYSLSLPSCTKLRDGQSRHILRGAMADRMPAELVRRTDKYEFSPHFRAGLAARGARVMTLTDPGAPGIADYVNLARLQTARDNFQQKGAHVDMLDALFLWRVGILNLWLNDVALRRHSAALLPLDDRET